MTHPPQRRRPRRSTAIQQRLERMRHTKAQLDAERHAREQRENHALHTLAQHAENLDRIQHDRDTAIAALQKKIQRYQQKIDQLRTQADDDIATADHHHAEHFLALKEAGRTADQIATLTGRPQKTIQHLLREAERRRQTVNKTDTTDRNSSASPSLTQTDPTDTPSSGSKLSPQAYSRVIHDQSDEYS